MEELKQLRFLAQIKLSSRFGQRGAEMVEYAIVLACIVVLGLWFYSDPTGQDGSGTEAKGKTLVRILKNLWSYISGSAAKF